MYQQQLRAVASQKEALAMQLTEIKGAKTELEKATGDVYRISGPLLIRSTKPEAAADLAEKEELVNVRLKTLETSEKKLKSKLDELKEKLNDKSIIVPKKKSDDED